MSDELDSEETTESGGSLRAKLEASLAENKTLAAELHQFKARDIITAKGLKHVRPDDLAGVSLADLEAKAEELEAQNAAADAEAVRRVLAAKGLDASAVDKAVTDLLSGESTTETLDRIRSGGRIGGDPPGTNKFEGLYGRDKIYAAYSDQ